ncbi:MAG TPA: DUF3450 domain-containing protein [Gammaproteobacteria bacterium]|nr:DUF3450 domain-containing protein [Gammaproteobacteria bacterium]
MTRSDSNKKLVLASGRSLMMVGLAGVVGVAFAQDTGNRYAQILADADTIARYNVHLQQQLQSQQAEIASLEQQIAGMDATALDVPPLLQRMFDELEQFVMADVPFLQSERTERIARLRDLMNQVDAPQAEKYRRLMEAYQIEMEYGRAMDSYTEALSDGREAEFVRLGRVSLMYRTVDGQETGYWDNAQKAWVVDEDYDRVIEQALRIAKQEGAPDLIVVPVPAAQEGRS